MGFPVPLKEWFGEELREFVQDLFRSQAAQTRAFFNSKAVLANFDKAGPFSRKTWGLISLEIWHQLFHDQAARIRWDSAVMRHKVQSAKTQVRSAESLGMLQ